jgi:hypothetical protein
MARYNVTYRKLLAKIFRPTLHVDEMSEVTEGKGYVWVFTTLKKSWPCISHQKESFQELLKNFHGVLVLISTALMHQCPHEVPHSPHPGH